MTKRTVSILVVVLIGLGACGGGGSSVSAYCSLAKSDKSKYANLGSSSSDTKTALAAFKELEGKAPSEIKSDFKLIYDDAKKIEADPTSAASLDQTKFNAALKSVEKFTLDKCKVDLNN